MAIQTFYIYSFMLTDFFYLLQQLYHVEKLRPSAEVALLFSYFKKKGILIV